MRTHKLKTVLVAASILALGAGVFAGMAVSRLPNSGSPAMTPETPVPPGPASIADELQLTDGQRDQMRSIWEGVRDNVHETLTQAQVVQRERDAAIVAILTDSQKARYAALTQQAAERLAALNSQREQAFHDGVDKTRKILNDMQRQTYDNIIRDRVGSGSEGASGDRGLTSPTTEPVVR